MKTLFSTGFRPADPFSRRGPELGLLAIPGYKIPDLIPGLNVPPPAPAYTFAVDAGPVGPPPAPVNTTPTALYAGGAILVVGVLALIFLA